MLRRPKVAGQFYPNGACALRKQLRSFAEEKEIKIDALGVVVPHAGYVFSGSVAGACFSRVKLTKTVIILGPNHTGLGAPFSVMAEGLWQTPLGNVEVDASFAKDILDESKYLQEDTGAHVHEHSIEVQLPFLQLVLPEIKIVPIILSEAAFMVYDEIGMALARVIKNRGQSLIVASNDMTHYETQQKAEANDKLAIESMLKLDGKELLERIKKHNITMCGYAAVITMLSAAKELGAQEAKLIKYQTSGDASGDYSSVVGYAGIIVKKIAY